MSRSKCNWAEAVKEKQAKQFLKHQEKRGWNQKPRDLKYRNRNEKKSPTDGRKQKCEWIGNPSKEEQAWWGLGPQKGEVW